MLTAAISLADAEGIEAVTLRSVAHQTRSPLAEVQRSFASRDQLVFAMTQDVYRRRDVRLTSPGRPAETLMHLARMEWAVYGDHPWLVTVLTSTRPPLTPVVLDIARAYVDAFVAMGMDRAVALGRYVALNSYVQGMAMLVAAEQRERTRTQKSPESWWSEEMSRLNRTGAPAHSRWIAEVSAGDVPDSADISNWFQDGLGLFIAGLTEDVASGRSW